MTLQTCDYHEKSKLVFGIPVFQFSKPNGIFGSNGKGIQQQIVVQLTSFQKCVCEKENYQYKKDEVYYSSCSYLINRDTLEVSVNGEMFEKVSFEKCLIEGFIPLDGDENNI